MRLANLPQRQLYTVHILGKKQCTPSGSSYFIELVQDAQGRTVAAHPMNRSLKGPIGAPVDWPRNRELLEHAEARAGQERSETKAYT